MTIILTTFSLDNKPDTLVKYIPMHHEGTLYLGDGTYDDSFHLLVKPDDSAWNGEMPDWAKRSNEGVTTKGETNTRCQT